MEEGEGRGGEGRGVEGNLLRDYCASTEALGQERLVKVSRRKKKGGNVFLFTRF